MTITREQRSQAEIYRKAAKYMEDGHTEYVCHALDHHNLSCLPMRDMFDGVLEDRQWGVWMSCDGDDSYPGGADFEAQLDRRILALCFMAAITERP